MATNPYIPIEVYLQADYESDVDYVDDHVEERNLGEREHAAWQLAVLLWFAQQARDWNTVGLPECEFK